MGSLQRLELLNLGSEPAQSDRVCADDDGYLHERSRTNSRSGTSWPDDEGSIVQPDVQPILLRDPFHAGTDAVHGYAGHSDGGLCRRGIQQS